MAKRAIDDDMFADDSDDVSPELEADDAEIDALEAEEDSEDDEIEKAATSMGKKKASNKPKAASKSTEDVAEEKQVPAPKAKKVVQSKTVKSEDAEERPKSKGKEVKKTMASKKNSHRSTARAKRTVQRGPVLAGYFSKPKTLHAKYHNKDLKAQVLADGTIKFDGKTFTSPSGAGSSIRKGNSKVDGWLFWKIEDKNGNLVPLDTVRQKKSA